LKPEAILNLLATIAFEHCESLASFVIPDSVRTIGTGAFYGCESLSDITISDHSKLESVMEFAFGIPRGWKTIPDLLCSAILR
jgi:hypothetical protein